MTGARLFLVGLLGVVLVSGLLWWQLGADENHGKVIITNATANPVPGSGQTVLVSLTIKNDGPPQKIVGISSTDADHTMIHGIEPKTEAIIPANSSVTLGSDGVHFMLMNVKDKLDDGRLLTLNITLEPAGDVVTKARFADQLLSGHGMHQMVKNEGDDDQQMEAVFHAPDGEPQPTLSLTTQANAEEGGWLITADTENFTFSKELSDGPHVPGTGHGHIYINGIKLGRLYEKTAKIGALTKGDHVVRVTLNTNNHKTYNVAGKAVTATATISVD